MMIREKLEKLYDIGSSKRVFQSEWRSEGVPFYRAREIAKLAIDDYVDNELFIDEELYDSYVEKYGKPQPGDIMVTGVGTLGVCYIVKPDDKFYFKDGNILWFKQKAPDRILPEYLVKLFDSNDVREFISRNSSGTTVGTFTIQTAKKLEINLPSLEEQKRIIQKLAKIENIINNRKKELVLLDDCIKARFVEMFGDFESNSKQLEIETLGQLGFWSSGGTPSRTNPDYFTGDINWYSAGELNSLFLDESVEKITKEAINNSAAKLFKAGSMLVGMYDTAAFKMGILKEDSASNQACACIEPNERIDIVWLYYALTMMKNHYLSQRRGVRQKNLNLGMIKGFKLPIAQKNEQLTFVSFVKQIDKSKFNVNCRNLYSLCIRKVRGTLWP